MSKEQRDLYDSVPDGAKVRGSVWGKDEVSGEDVVLPVYLQKPKQKDYNLKWLLLWQEEAEGTGVSMIEQAVENKLTLVDYRVRDYMLCKVGIGNFVHFSQSEAAKVLNILQPNISKSIKKLIEMGILLQGPSTGRFKTYQINPAFIFSGRMGEGVKQRNEQIAEGKKRAIVTQFKPQQGNLLEDA